MKIQERSSECKSQGKSRTSPKLKKSKIKQYLHQSTHWGIRQFNTRHHLWTDGTANMKTVKPLPYPVLPLEEKSKNSPLGLR